MYRTRNDPGKDRTRLRLSMIKKKKKKKKVILGKLVLRFSPVSTRVRIRYWS